MSVSIIASGKITRNDGLNYVKQCEEIRKENKKNKRLKTADEFLSGIRQEDRLKPVVTLVIYFGEEEWDGPLTLKDMLEQINPEIEPFSTEAAMTIGCITGSESLIQYAEKSGEEKAVVLS